MKSRFVGNVLLIGALISSTAVMADYDWDCVTPYVGADIQWRHMEFKKNFGNKETARNYPQGNIYLGTRINDCFGVELGYESTTEKKRTVSQQFGDNDFGAAVLRGDSYTTQTKTSLRGFHLDLVGFLPICEEYCLELFGAVGIAPLQLKVVEDVPTVLALPNPFLAQDRRTFKKTKWVPRVNIGIQHMFCFCEQLGARATAGWEGTSAFKITSRESGLQKARVKDSWILGIGLFYNFC